MIIDTFIRMFGPKAIFYQGDPFVTLRYIWLKDRMMKGKKILDAGCGDGGFALYAAKNGNNVLGISFEKDALDTANRRAKIIGVNAQFVPEDLRELHKMKLGKYDQIFCLETVEHIMNDKKLAADLSKLLKKGGEILLTTPYGKGPWMRGESISDVEDGGHVRKGYTKGDLERIFKPAGVEITEVRYFGNSRTRFVTTCMRMLNWVHSYFAWAVCFPLRILQIGDVPKATPKGSYSIAMVGKKR